MKNQLPIRILIAGAVTASSALPADQEEYWNVQWNKNDQKQIAQANIPNKNDAESPLFFPLADQEKQNPPQAAVESNEDDDWGLELQQLKSDNKDINQTATTPAEPAPKQEPAPAPKEQLPKTIMINFNNVSIVEYIRFISRISGKNFVFDERDLLFNVTIISEGPTTIQNVMITLLQELRVHDFSMMEEGNTIIIYKNDEVRNVSKVMVDEVPVPDVQNNQLITQVLRLNTLDPAKAAVIVKPMLSKSALMEISEDSRQLIITDIISNIEQVSILLKGIDSPNGGQVLGQYVVQNALIDNLITLTKEIIAPIALEQPVIFVPHPTAQSIFVVSSPFIVERTLAVMQHLDQRKGENKIFTLDDLKFIPSKQGEAGPSSQTGRWEIDSNGKWIFRPGGTKPEELPHGKWMLDPQGNWYFVPDGTQPPFTGGKDTDANEFPRGSWVKDANGNWTYQLMAGETIRPERLKREYEHLERLPIGNIERTQFTLYKLKYRSGKDVVAGIENMGKSLEESGVINKDLALSISILQWIEPTNSIIITGTGPSIQKIKELIQEIDTPLKQVFIEMLVLETDLDSSLQFGVSWGAHGAGGSTSTAEAFISGASSLGGLLFNKAGNANIDVGSASPPGGFSLGIIGQKLTHGGTVFSDLGLLVRFLNDQTIGEILMNPKILVEDNKPAELFVGINTAFQNESIANDQGSIITTNFQFRDVGTTLNVTPHISSNDLINIEIKLENSTVVTGSTSTAGQNLSNTAPAGPTTSINRTSTIVVVPSGCFLILSGMIHEDRTNDNFAVPCLGGVPVIGAAFKSKTRNETRRNLMIFMRPVIVETEEQLNTLTKRQQDIYDQKGRVKEEWKFDMDEALDWLNLRVSCDPCDPCRD